MAYGEPRLTHDIDLVVNLTRNDVHRLAALFPLSQFYCPPEEVISLEIARSARGHFNIIHHDTGLKADIYPVGDDPLHRWALQRIRRVATTSCEIPLAPPEYVIIRKLEYYREGASNKHIRDIRNMIELLGDELDYDVVAQFANSRGLDVSWKQIVEHNT